MGEDNEKKLHDAKQFVMQKLQENRRSLVDLSRMARSIGHHPKKKDQDTVTGRYRSLLAVPA